MPNELMHPDAPARFGGYVMPTANAGDPNHLHIMTHGSMAQRILASGFDPDVFRPMFGTGPRNQHRSFIRQKYFTANGEVKDRLVPVANANTLLRKDEWIKMDERVMKVARTKLRLWADLAGSGATYNIPDGMGVLTLQHQAQSDITAAQISMDGMARSKRDRMDYGLVSVPCPIIHKDVNFGLREIMASRRGNTPLDLSWIDQATTKVIELVEQLVAGSTSFSYSAGALYGSTGYGTTSVPDSAPNIKGYTNFGPRLTKTFTSPTSSGWIPQTTVLEVLDAIQSLSLVSQYGPFVCYYAPSWSKYMGDDYSMAKGTNTLIQRLKDIPELTDVRRANYLSNYDLVFVALGDSNTAEAVTGMALNVVQWEAEGGMELHYKVMCIMFPRLRAHVDESGNTSTGLLHASV